MRGFCRELFSKINDFALQVSVFDLTKRLYDILAFATDQKVRDICRGHGPLVTCFAVARDLRFGGTLEEERHRHIQYSGELLHPACADPVGAFLVLLDLLEGKTDGITETRLGHSDHEPSHTDPRTHMLIGRLRSLRTRSWHRNPPLVVASESIAESFLRYNQLKVECPGMDESLSGVVRHSKIAQATSHLGHERPI